MAANFSWLFGCCRYSVHRPMRSRVLSLYVVTWMPVGSSFCFFTSSKMVWYTLSGMMLISAHVSTLILKQSFVSSFRVFCVRNCDHYYLFVYWRFGFLRLFDLVYFGADFDLACLISCCRVVLVLGHVDLLFGL